MSTRLQNPASDMSAKSTTPSKAQSQPPHSSPLKQPAVRFVLLLLAVAMACAGYFRLSHPPTYVASAIVSVPTASLVAATRVSQPGRVIALLQGAETSATQSHDDKLTVVANPAIPNAYTFQATADSPQAAASIANNAAQTIVNQTKVMQRLAMRRKAPVVAMSTEIQVPLASNATISPSSPISPQGQTTSLTIIGALLAITLIALVVSLIPESRPANPAKAAVSQQAASPLSATTTTRSVTQQEARAETIPQSVETAAPATVAFATLDADGSVSASLDPSFTRRLDEFKAAGTQKGCVFVVSDANAVGTVPAQPNLNAAQTALAFAQEIRKSTGLSTLLIDCGSSAWSTSRVQGAENQLPADVINLPNSGPGVYEILKESVPVESWNIGKDDATGVLSIASGSVLSRWPEILRSEQMQKFVEDAKMLAPVIVIYGPPCLDRPETVRVLGDWSNGIVLVGASTQGGAAAESHAVEILRSAGARIFGRISLQQTA